MPRQYLPNKKSDYRSKLAKVTTKTIERPKTKSLRDLVPFIYDQGQIGSCTANAICMALVIQSKSDFRPSRLWIYYQERVVELPAERKRVSDSGADALDGLEILELYGVPDEVSWPYDVKKCNVAPPAECFEIAAKHKVHDIKQIDIQDGNLEPIILTITSGIPVLISIELYNSFESDEVGKTGIVPLPCSGEEYLGNHEVLIVGYDDNVKVFTCVNSWGDSWGDKGFFTIPYEYLLKHLNEAICIATI